MIEPPHICNCDSEQCYTPFYNRLYHDGDECVHLDGTHHKIKSKELIRVQYNNLYGVVAIEKCEILGSAQSPMSEEEKELFNQKILIVCKGNSNLTKYLVH